MEISNLIKTTNVIETKGKEILKKNDFFKKLINLMNSHEFNDFYESYFNDWSDIETIIFYIKLYKTIDYEYSRRFEDDISDEAMTYTLYNVMNNTSMRKMALSKFSDFKQSKNIDMKQNKEFRYLLDFSNVLVQPTTRSQIMET